MTSYLIAASLILALLAAWVSVQHLARRFATRHPEFGPHRERSGCGLACPCDSDEPCPNRKENQPFKPQRSQRLQRNSEEGSGGGETWPGKANIEGKAMHATHATESPKHPCSETPPPEPLSVEDSVGRPLQGGKQKRAVSLPTIRLNPFGPGAITDPLPLIAEP